MKLISNEAKILAAKIKEHESTPQTHLPNVNYLYIYEKGRFSFLDWLYLRITIRSVLIKNTKFSIMKQVLGD